MKSQTQKLYDLLSDGLGHSTAEIMEVVYGNSHLGLARVSARIFDLKQRGHEIVGTHDTENPSLYWYRMTKDATKPPQVQIAFKVERVSGPIMNPLPCF